MTQISAVMMALEQHSSRKSILEDEADHERFAPDLGRLLCRHWISSYNRQIIIIANNTWMATLSFMELENERLCSGHGPAAER